MDHQTLRGGEPRVARRECHRRFATVQRIRRDHPRLCRQHDVLTADLVGIPLAVTVGHEDLIARPQLIEVEERRTVGRPVSGHREVAPLARERRVGIVPRPLRELARRSGDGRRALAGPYQRPTLDLFNAHVEEVSRAFALDELRARIRCLLRRPSSAGTAALTVGPLVLDTAALSATWDGNRIDLTPKELAVLRYLALRPGIVVSQEELLEHVWDRNADPFTDTVRVTVGTLRRKLAAHSSSPPIETVIGCGYRLVAGQ